MTTFLQSVCIALIGIGCAFLAGLLWASFISGFLLMVAGVVIVIAVSFGASGGYSDGLEDGMDHDDN